MRAPSIVTASTGPCASTSPEHSLLGASKLAAGVMSEEYGRYFDTKTHCRRGGCLTGPHQSGVELHGFLSYLVKTRAVEAIAAAPGEVYDLGGERDNARGTSWLLHRVNKDIRTKGHVSKNPST